MPRKKLPPRKKVLYGAIKEIANDWGSYFFSKNTMSFFKSKLAGPAYEAGDSIYFGTQEAVYGTARVKYTVRRMNLREHTIRTVGRDNVFYSKRDLGYAIRICCDLGEEEALLTCPEVFGYHSEGN